MGMNGLRVRGNEAGDPNDYSVRKHCLIITLIGLSAIGVAMLLPGDPQRSTSDTANRAQRATTGSASAAMKGGPPGKTAAQPSDSADKPFDYFPAQFPTPSGDVSEPAPTF